MVIATSRRKPSRQKGKCPARRLPPADGRQPPSGPQTGKEISCGQADFHERMTGMIVVPKIRGFICTTAHPAGCAQHVAEQIAVVKNRGPVTHGPKKVLVIGASTGYGLASRIAAAFGSNAATIGVFFERGGEAERR